MLQLQAILRNEEKDAISWAENDVAFADDRYDPLDADAGSFFWRAPMNSDNRREPWLDPAFLENQRRFPAGELICFAGQHIAWSWDGSRILAHDPDRRALDEKLRAAGIDPLQVIHDYVEDPILSYLA